LTLAGIAAVIALASGGPEPRAKWGYTAATLAFLLSTAQAAPLAALIPRLVKGFWATPLHRAADLFGLTGLVTAPLFIVLLFQLPDWTGRESMWSGWPRAPQLWDIVAVVVLALAGLALVYVICLPDVGPRRPRAGWRGGERQWTVLTSGLVLVAGFYAMLLVFVHLLLTADLSMSLVPKWQSPEIPPFHVIAAIQAGIATVLLVAGALRRFGRLGHYLDLDPFWGSAKLLLALAMLFFYFFWSEFLVDWYGRTDKELNHLEVLMFGPYVIPFAGSLLLQFFLPFALLIWNRVRVSITGPIVASALILAGNYLLQVWLFVPAWAVAGPVTEDLAAIPAPRWPGPLDALVLAGGPAAAGLLVLLAMRFVPPIAIW